MSQEHEMIEFEPHYHTLTDGGKSHFVRVADALAEFCDNAIEACKNSIPRRVIRIVAGLSKSRNDNFMLIMDNGYGMDSNKLKEFATFSLDQGENK